MQAGHVITDLILTHVTLSSHTTLNVTYDTLVTYARDTLVSYTCHTLVTYTYVTCDKNAKATVTIHSKINCQF